MIMIYLKNLYLFYGKKNNVEVECSLKWNAGYGEDVLSLYE